MTTTIQGRKYRASFQDHRWADEQAWLMAELHALGCELLHIGCDHGPADRVVVEFSICADSLEAIWTNAQGPDRPVHPWQ